MNRKGTIPINKRIVQKAGLEAADIGGEVVLIYIAKGKYYCFNSVGSRIWELIQRPITIDQLKTVLMMEFEVDEKTCEENVLGFINGLYDEELISVV